MPEKLRYPQIPSTVWWGLRALLQKTPKATIDERRLGYELGVQETAARQYIAELRHAGILNDENRATDLADRWRHDDTYSQASAEILEKIYPSSLIESAPPDQTDRARVVSWFTREGFGSGTANNKAATYLLIGSPTPADASGRALAKDKVGPSRSVRARVPRSGAASVNPSAVSDEATKPQTSRHELMPLNVNVQIHISADASADQIESIFSAMRRYLYEKPAS
jgi:hypothetical protein